MRQLGSREARQSASSTCRHPTSSEEHVRGDRRREARAVVKEASDQEKNSCGKGGRERQRHAERQAERQRRYQVELGQFQDMLADTSPDSCSTAWFVAARVDCRRTGTQPSWFALLLPFIKAIAGFTVKKAAQLTAAADAFRPGALGKSRLPCRLCFP